MKRMIAVLAALCTAVFSITAYADTDISIGYISADFELSLEGSCESEFLNLVVVPKGYYGKENDLTETELEGGNIILKTVKTTEGQIDEAIKLSAEFPKGCYVAALYDGEKSSTRIFANSDPAVLASVASAYASTDDTAGLIEANLTKLGFETGFFSELKGNIVKILDEYFDLYNADADNFADVYLLSEGIASMQAGKITATEMLTLYSGIVSADIINNYSALDYSVKEELGEVMILQDYTSGKFEKVFEEAVILSKVNALGKKAKEDMLDYFEKNGADMEDYEDLSSYYKELALGELFSKNDYLHVEELISKFESCAAEQLKASKKGGGSSTGGSSGGGGNFSVKDAVIAESEQKELFYDIENHWAKQDIISMATSNIISGFSDGSFKPDNKITRAEFAKILSGILKLDYASGDKFTDVTQDKWFAPFVYSVADYGLINGVSDTSFAPNSNITREDATVILHRLLLKKGVEFEASAEFTDSAEISDYAKNAVLSLANGEIIKGADGRFNPKSNLTRAEAVTLLSRIYGYIK